MTGYLEDERLVDLLTKRATEGLGPEEADELESLLAEHPDADIDAFDRVAAAVELAARPRLMPLPPGLESRLEADAARYFHITATPPPAQEPTAPVVALRRSRPHPWLWVAAAATIILAVIAWWPDADEVSGLVPPASALRASLLEQARAQQIEWSLTEDPSAQGVTGDVVWDSQNQTGYMLFRGLAANDPTISQYQLWIFDAERDERYPVDGGVFDIPPDQDEVVVPIAAKLPVTQATLFAITVERPGGVVVSSRERLLLLAETG